MTDDWRDVDVQLFDEPRRSGINCTLLRWYFTQWTAYLVSSNWLEPRQLIHVSTSFDHWGGAAAVAAGMQNFDFICEICCKFLGRDAGR